jgi:hypothetical protein
MLAVYLVCSQAYAGSTLNFPRVSFDSDTLTGIAFVNPSDQTATVRVVAYGEDGSPVGGQGFQNPVEFTISPHRQNARLLSEIFGGSFPADQISWMQATSSVDGITGFFLYLDPTLSFFDGADLPESGRKIVFNEVRSDQSSSTELSVFNPGSAPALLNLTLNRPGQDPLHLDTPINLAAKGLTRFEAGALFGLESVQEGSSLAVVSSAPIGGFEFVRFQGEDLLGLNAKLATESLSDLYFPQLAVHGPWKTEVGVVSYGEQPSILTISAYRADGTLFTAPELIGSNPVTRILPAGQALLEDVESLFQFAGEDTLTGWLKVESSSASINGFVSYGIPSGGSRAAVAAQPVAQEQALFSHIATDFGYFTGVALLNAGSFPSNYRVIAFTKEGERIGSFEGLLRPGQRVTRLINEMIEGTAAQSSGFFVVFSEQPLYMTSLFGTATVLANIAPQASTALSSLIGGPSSRVTPPLAVLKPGASFQYQATDFNAEPEWKVEDVPGGDSQVGTVTPTGVYTAPATSPELLPVTVSAEGPNQVSGAAADVLEPSALLQNQGVIRSVAYLRSLKRLYSAEVATQGAFGLASGPVPAADDASRIIQLYPGEPDVRASFDGESISKMIPYTASNGTEFLLFTGSVGGKVVRLNPVDGEFREIITGLNSPSALVVDPVGGNLLVAEQDQVRSFPRPVIEGGLSSGAQANTAARSPSGTVTRLASGQVLSGLLSSEGLAVDACTGKLYISDSGAVLEYDRLTGATRTIYDVLDRPGQLLSLYRSGLPCPFAFHLLVTNPDGESPVLLVPSRGLELPWVGSTGTVDLAFVPSDNSLVDSEAVLFGDSTPGDGSTIDTVAVPNLYSDHPSNPAGAIPSLDFADTVGDTFGIGPSRPDAWSVVTFLQEPTTTSSNAPLVFLQGDSTSGNEIVSGLKLTFRNQVSLPGSGQENALYGWIDLDTDQNPLTGRTSFVDQLSNYSTGIGSDYILDFGGFNAADETISLLRVGEDDLQEIGRIPVAFVDDPLSGGTDVLIDFRIQDIDPDGFANVAILVGNSSEATDAIPNGGYLSSGRPLP